MNFNRACPFWKISPETPWGPQTRNVWTPCDMVTLLLAAHVSMHQKIIQKKKGWSRPSWRQLKTKSFFFIRTPVARPSDTFTTHDVFVFPHNFYLSSQSLGTSNIIYYTNLGESLIQLTVNLPTSICCTGARTNTPPPPLKMVDTNGRANDKGPPFGNQAPFM